MMARLSVLFACGLWASASAHAETRLVMFGKSDCSACREFFRESLKDYWVSPDSLVMPLSIVDTDALGTAGHALKAPLIAFPTFVLMRDGREIGRLVGYPGRDGFIASIAAWRQQIEP